MDNILLAGTGKIGIPKNVLFFKNNKEYLAPTLTKSGNITKRNKKPVIQFEKSDNPESFIYISNKGETKTTQKKNKKLNEIDNERKILSVEHEKLINEIDGLNKNTKKYKELYKKLGPITARRNELFNERRTLLGLGFPQYF